MFISFNEMDQTPRLECELIVKKGLAADSKRISSKVIEFIPPHEDVMWTPWPARNAWRTLNMPT
jgi:hypothetical protein